MSNSPTTHNIVILGASYAGIGVAHGVLKALPGLKSQTGKSYKVILMSNSTHFWFSVGAPRAMLIPFPKDIMDSFIPISKGFEQYPSESYQFVHAEITGLNTGNREVVYKSMNDRQEIAEDANTTRFDTLVIATGSTGPSPLYALRGSHVPTLEAYKDIQARLPAAKSVMVIGGGSAGTETAGELGHLHGKKTSSPKDITILSGNERLLTALRPAIGQRAQEFLEEMGVKVVHHNLRLTGYKDLPNGKTEVSLTDGSTQTVDILIVATGRKPASSSIPSSLLDKESKVIVDPYQRLPSLESAYALGDVASNSPGGLIYMQTMTPTTVGNIVAELGGKGKGKEFKPMSTKEMQFVPVGPNKGVGAAFGWWVPSVVVKMAKSKDFMFGKAMANVMGTA
ncbi:hypothetical protein MMC28_000289 [Mycoblastus sanguinarius]|nr:hypothetical protein [Mycoblastus sanguinarius]